MITFDCKITKWYYFLVFYYNPNKPEYSLNISLLKKYLNDVGILLYNPIEKKFYDCYEKPIESLNLDEISDLDKNYLFLQMDTFKTEELPKKGQSFYPEEIKKDFLKDFEFMKCDNYKQIMEKISQIMEIKSNLDLLHKLLDVKFYKIPPFRNIILLYKKKNKGFLGIKTVCEKNVFERTEFYDLEEGIKIDDFYSRYDDKYGYLYSLIIKNKKRNYNEFRDEYSNIGEFQEEKLVSKKIFKGE